MCAYMRACEHPTTTTWWIGKVFILHESLVCFGKLWLQIYQLESSCTVVPSCERNILMQIDTDIILIVLDPKQYMPQNILKYWSVWRWFKPSLKACNVFGDFWDQPYVGLSFVNAHLCIISKIMFVWFQHNVSPVPLVTLSDNTTRDDFGYSNGLHHTDNMRERVKLTASLTNLSPWKNRGNGQRRNTYRRKPLEKSSTSKWCGRHIDIPEVKKTIAFIKKHLIKLQLKLEIQREATKKK